MNKFLMSEEAYKEFKAFLDENEVEKYSIRVNLQGFRCTGPVFNMTIEEANEDDVVETINAITLMAKNELIDQFGGFKILSSKENDGNGLSLESIIKVPGRCCHGGNGSCKGNCHHD